MDKPIGREGHRERMRASFLAGEMKNAPDHNLLELFLSIVIPRKDVKQLSYDLLNEFGSLESVIYADTKDLMRVNGIGESSAVAISCIKQINDRIVKNRNNGLKSINSRKEAVNYCRNIIGNEKVENVLQITLKTDGTIINSYLLNSGDVGSTSIDLRKLISNAAKDNAASVLLAHNHPDTDAIPSANDISFTISLKNILKRIDIELVDHIIISPYDSSSVLDFM